MHALVTSRLDYCDVFYAFEEWKVLPCPERGSQLVKLNLIAKCVLCSFCMNLIGSQLISRHNTKYDVNVKPKGTKPWLLEEIPAPKWTFLCADIIQGDSAHCLATLAEAGLMMRGRRPLHSDSPCYGIPCPKDNLTSFLLGRNTE